MELLAETEDDQEARGHRLIARYLKHFLSTVPEEVASLYQHAKEGPEPTALDPANGGTPWMEDDGTTNEVDL